jgi:cation diffusion facilitator family transporter
MTGRRSLTRFAWLSIAAAVATIALKSGAYFLTGSVGLLSDAMESMVNLVAAIAALIALSIAARPADDSHHYGHGKAEYFSAAFEGGMILLAATLIVISAVHRLLHPQALQSVGLGLAVTTLATLLHGVVGVLLVRVGRRERSITLEADGKHLLTDVWTSVGVIVGVGVVGLTGIERLDPIIALLVAANIVWTGSRLVSRSASGLMDAALPASELALIDEVLDHFRSDTVTFHALRTRESGHHRFVSVHVLVPGEWSVKRGHDLVESLEEELVAVLPDATVDTHLEPIEDPASWRDVELGPDRVSGRPAVPPPDAAGHTGS